MKVFRLIWTVEWHHCLYHTKKYESELCDVLVMTSKKWSVICWLSGINSKVKEEIGTYRNFFFGILALSLLILYEILFGKSFKSCTQI